MNLTSISNKSPAWKLKFLYNRFANYIFKLEILDFIEVHLYTSNDKNLQKGLFLSSDYLSIYL